MASTFATLGAGLGGAGLGILGSIFGAGKKVKVPELKKVSPEQEQQAAIKQNIASLEPATQLAEKTTAAEQSMLEQQLRKAIPNYDQMLNQMSQNIGSALKGEVSADVAGQLQRSAAGRALSGGFGAGTGAGRALSARDLGLTSMQIQQQGLGQAMDFMRQQRSIGMVQPFSVSSMFISPSQRINLAFQQNQMQYSRDLAAAQAAAQADPFMAAIGGTLSNVGGMALGAAMQSGMNQLFPTQQRQQSPMIPGLPNANYTQQFGVGYNMPSMQAPTVPSGSNDMLSMMYAPPPQTGGYAQSIWGGP